MASQSNHQRDAQLCKAMLLMWPPLTHSLLQDPYAKRFMKDEKITKTAYIANSGGLLGLCMGFSLVSAAEILYHCLFGLFSPICGGGRKNTKDRLYRVYTYSKDAETGLCDRHQQADIVKFSDYQKTELGSEMELETELPNLFPPSAGVTRLSGSFPSQLSRPCLVHNGGPPGPPSCPAHGPRPSNGGPRPSNGCLPGHSSKYSGFSPERVI